MKPKLIYFSILLLIQKIIINNWMFRLINYNWNDHAYTQVTQ